MMAQKYEEIRNVHLDSNRDRVTSEGKANMDIESQIRKTGLTLQLTSNNHSSQNVKEENFSDSKANTEDVAISQVT